MNTKTVFLVLLAAAGALLFTKGTLFAGPVADGIKSELVKYENNQLVPFDGAKLSGVKVFAFYYSAHWCPPCRKFTPELVQFYNRVKKDHPEFELVFVSSDRSRDGMIGYMRETKMQWPAVDFGKGAAIRKYAGPGIPCLVVVDENGKVLSDSYEGSKYVGPYKVMTDLNRILAKNKSSVSPSQASFDEFFKKKPVQPAP